jgi:hypothetical protein
MCELYVILKKMARLQRLVYSCMPQHSNIGSDVGLCLAPLLCAALNTLYSMLGCATDGEAYEFCDIIYFLFRHSEFSTKLGVSFRNIVLTLLYKWQDYGPLS